MGIRQLTSYFKLHHASLFKEKRDLTGSKVVIDGDALLYSLLESVSNRYGGEYNEMSKRFREFFNELHSIQITPFVVLDGCINISLKCNTVCERITQSVKALQNISDSYYSHTNFPLPLFSKQVLIEVMEELNINFVVAPNEADMLLAVFANALNCPVVSSDSDLFIVNVVAGVIAMSSFLNISNLTNIDCYNLKNLAQLLHLATDKIPFIAIILGNDYSVNQYLKLIQKKCGIIDQHGNLIKINARLQKVAEYLNSKSDSHEIVLSFVQDAGEIAVDLKKHIESILDEYNLCLCQLQASSLLPILLRKETNPEDFKSYTSMTDYLKIMCSYGMVHTCVLNIYFGHAHFLFVQSENVSAKSATLISRELINIIYDLCSITGTIKEFQRVGLDYKETLRVIDKPATMTNISDKRLYMCQLAGLDFHECTNEDILVVISLRHWIIKSNETNNQVGIEHIKALAITYLSLKVNCHKRSDFNVADFDIVVGHRFCEWQSILHYLMVINCLLSFPFSLPKLSQIFSGKRAHSAYKKLLAGENEDRLVNDVIKYESFLKSVTDGLSHCVKCTHHSKKKKEKKINIESSSNRFASLEVFD